MPMVIDIDGSSTVIRATGPGRLDRERLADRDLRDTSDGDDVSGSRRLGRLSIQCVGDQQLESLTVRIVPSARHQATF